MKPSRSGARPSSADRTFIESSCKPPTAVAKRCPVDRRPEDQEDRRLEDQEDRRLEDQEDRLEDQEDRRLEEPGDHRRGDPLGSSLGTESKTRKAAIMAAS
jgi:hypothetical protein